MGRALTLAKEAEAGSIVWAALKSPQRAVEKAVRCYDGEVWRLMDVCRQAVIFDAVDDIRRCLALIVADDERGIVRLVRVKNRLAPGYDAGQCAGYRDVALNIRVAAPGQEGPGPAALQHICELQLILRPFAMVAP